MISINISSDIDKIVKAYGRFGRELKDKAIAPALNKTIAKARTEMTRAITTEFAIKAIDVRANLQIRRASANRSKLVAVLQAFSSSRRGRSLNLIRFLERKVSLAEARRRGKQGTLKELAFQIKKAGGVKRIKGAFIGNKGRTVFIRTEGQMTSRAGNLTKHSQAIKALSTIDVPQMFNTRRINGRMVQRVRKEFPIEFERALRMLIRK